MLALLSPYKLWIEIAILISLIGGAVVGVHKFLDYEQQIGWDKHEAVDVVQRLKDTEAARAKEALWKQQTEEANAKATEREKAITASAAVAAASSRNLRDTLEAYRGSVSGATAASLANAVGTLTKLLDDCGSRYSGLAEKADRHASDFQRCVDSWPKNGIAK